MDHRSQALCSTTTPLGSKRSKSVATVEDEDALGTLEDLAAAKVIILLYPFQTEHSEDPVLHDVCRMLC